MTPHLTQTVGEADEPTQTALSPIPTPEAFAQACRSIVAMHEGDIAHRVLDQVVTSLLTGLGYGEGMAIFLEAVRDRHAA